MKNDRRAKMEQIQITKPDDWHLHLRDNDMLKEQCQPLLVVSIAPL